MIDFIDLFSGIGGFRLGLEQCNLSYSSKNGRGKEEAQGEHEKRQGYDTLEWDGTNKEREIGTKRAINRGSERQFGYAFRCVWSCDWDKYANQVYEKRFGSENHHSGDIKGVDERTIPDHDLLCAGFPCQSFSVAGKRKGFQDTRGSTFFEICRIARAKRPSLLLLENVAGLLSHEEGRTFATILNSLEGLGYWVEWQILNSKCFGIPQNRERVFIVGHLGEAGGRPIFPVTETSGDAEERVPETPDEQIACSITVGYGKQNMRGSYMATTALDSNYWKGPDNHNQRTFINENTKIRRLTPIECERLQGFPDGFTEGISDTQRYKTLGNAVTVNVIEFLGRRILESYRVSGDSKI